ncbi:MAG: hypothetical protein AAFX05_14555 [Planctomycetota bacterium]
MNQTSGENSTRGLTWAALLARWTDFAKAGVALPQDETGQAWRDSISGVIALQAVTCALGEFDLLASHEQSHALDLAGVLLRRHAGEVNEAWRGQPMPEKLLQLLADARLAHEHAASLGVEYVVAAESLTVPPLHDLVEALLASGFGGEMLAARAGVSLGSGCPVLFLRPEADIPALPRVARTPGLVPPRQVYRQFDDALGKAMRDYVAPIAGAIYPGRPLLRQVMERGAVVVPADTDTASQDTTGGLPVVFASGETSG